MKVSHHIFLIFLSICTCIACVNVRLELMDIVEEWDDLGEVLGLPHSEVVAIKADHPLNVRQCLKEMVHQWFEGKGSGPPPSWKSLCEALRHPLVGRKDVASKIEKKYVI